MSLQKPDAAQIRAAISLLSWENDDLAKACGVTSQSISNIKRGVTRPQPRILAAIKRVLEFQGIEFLDHSGVRFRPNSIETFEGGDGFVRFFETIDDYVEMHGGDVCVSGVDEALFVKHQGDFAAVHMARMEKIATKRTDFTMRILIAEGDYNLVASNYAHYRWHSKKFFSPTAFYVFGDRLALISFASDPVPFVIMIKSPAFAEAYRQSFNFVWQAARIPTKKIK